MIIRCDHWTPIITLHFRPRSAATSGTVRHSVMALTPMITMVNLVAILDETVLDQRNSRWVVITRTASFTIVTSVDMTSTWQ